MLWVPYIGNAYTRCWIVNMIAFGYLVNLKGGIKSMDLSLLKEVHEADIKKVFKSIYIQNGLLKYLFARKVSTFSYEWGTF